MSESYSPVYAHSAEGLEIRSWEPLTAHLKAVAETAQALGSPFGAGSAAAAMGALHDIGKASPAFQTYLRGEGRSPDHSAAGALLAQEKYGPTIGKMLAFGIAGHHAGLANGNRPGKITSLDERMRRTSVPEQGRVLDQAPALASVCLLEPLKERSGSPVEQVFACQFLIRMLFSCLVDADFLETEKFYARLAGDTVSRGCDITIADLHNRLISHMEATFGDAGSPRSEVEAVRERVRRAVLAKADKPPGLFSLTVPTGGGKTLTSLTFALAHALRHGLRRVIYVIPFTSIIEQTAQIFRESLGSDEAVLEHHSAYEPAIDPEARDDPAGAADDEAPDGGRKVRLAAQNWDRPIVVTTAVQFFESLFANRPSRCRKLHNIARSVIVLDEAQTVPLKLLRPCLAAVNELARGYGCSVVLCTATQPAVHAEDGFTSGLTGVRELAPEPDRLYAELKRVSVTHLAEPVDDEVLADRLAGEEQILCIVNNRRHARELFGRLADLPGAVHLTTALCAAHRRERLAAVRSDLRTGRPVRLVATSLVEAGVDISFPVVYRAMAGLESIAQAAGRCNRHGERGAALGAVFVFEPAASNIHRPPPELRQCAEVAKEVIRWHEADPLGRDAVRAYFQALYWWRTAAGLDEAEVGTERSRGILPTLQEYRSSLDFPFADIAQAFRMIESGMVPVIVPFRPPTEPDLVHGLVEALRYARLPGGIARRLQPYLVQIPPRARAALIAAHAAEIIRPDAFGDQFVLLTNEQLYHADIGLDWDDPTFRNSQSDIF